MATQSAQHSIVRHIRNYMSGGLLAALAGLVTFPVLTRNLSVEGYGLLGLITASATMFVAVGKLGIQHAIVRYYAQIRENNSRFTLPQLVSTTLGSVLLLGLLTVSLWLIASIYIFPRFVGEGFPTTQLFVVGSTLLFLRLLVSIPVNFLRAAQRSARASMYSVVQRLFILVLIVALWATDSISTLTALLAMAMAELLAFLVMSSFARDYLSWKFNDFSGALAKVLLVYGIPLMVLESVGLLLRLSDRYIIEGFHGSLALGQYSASYNLTTYLQIVIASGIVQAVRPMYTELWEAEGRDSTVNFLEQSFRYFMILSIPFITVFSLVAPDLLSMLASDRYLAGTVVIPLVAISLLLEGAILFLGAGLYLGKKTHILMRWGLLTVGVNIALNLAVVPSMGIVGAACVTVASYLLFCLGVKQAAFEVVSFRLSSMPILRICVASILVYFSINTIETGSYVLNILLRGSSATVLFSIVVFLLDREIAVAVYSRIRPLLPGLLAKADGRWR